MIPITDWTVTIVIVLNLLVAEISILISLGIEHSFKM